VRGRASNIHAAVPEGAGEELGKHVKTGEERMKSDIETQIGVRADLVF